MRRSSFAIKEAAVALGVSERSVRRLIKAKKVRARLIGGVWRIPRGELCGWLGCDPASRCAVNRTRRCELAGGEQSWANLSSVHQPVAVQHWS
jgi:excisionase family DNA binding protein